MTAKISIIIISFIFMNLLIRVSSGRCKFGYTYDRSKKFRCQECGLSYVTTNIKIIGGIPAKRNSWPSQVLLTSPKLMGLCGGTLITPTCVITAAHCTVGKTARDYVVFLGAHKLNNLQNDPRTIKVGVKRIINHPLYNTNVTNMTNDIAIIILKRRVHLNRYIQLACLPPNIHKCRPKTVYAVGWGNIASNDSVFPNELYNVKMTIRKRNCHIDDPKTQICAGGYGKDTCQGDSGGGLYMFCRGKRTLVGVTSYGFGCGYTPGIYTNVIAYEKWINMHCPTCCRRRGSSESDESRC